VAGNHESPAVMNLSITGSFGIRNALEGAIAAGVVAVKAAGNDAVDAYQDRGNRAQGLIVAGATDRFDNRASFSDFGSLITVFAPGRAVYTASHTSDTAADSVSGTSFAAPLTAGVAALLLQQEPYASQSRIKDILVRSSTEGFLGDIGSGSANRLLYSRVSTSDYPPPASYPIAPSISGPDAVKPYSHCLYSANSGSVDPASYEWYSDGNVQSESSSFFRASAIEYTFQLEMHITDSSGRSWWNYKYVTVSNDAPECLDT